MRGKAHLVCGIIAGAGISALGIYFNKFSFSNSLLITSSSAFFSLIPDIDHPDSMLGHRIKPLSNFLKNNIGHRTITHSGLWLILFIFLNYISFNTFWFPLSLGSTIGFLSHLVSDSLTVGGVPWLWPLSRKKLRLTPIKSGEHDKILLIIADIILIGTVYAVFNFLPGLI